LLLGRDVDLARFDIELDLPFSLGPNIDFSLLGLVNATFNPGTVSLFADIGVAYDTFGLRKFANQVATGQSPTADVLLDGFYIDNEFTVDDTGQIQDIKELQIGLGAEVRAGLNGGLFKLEVGGGIDANLGFGITDEGIDIDSDPFKVRLDEFQPCNLSVSGGLSADANLLMQVGVDLGFGFVGFEIDEKIGGPIVNFDTGHGCEPEVPIALYDSSTESLRLNPGRDGADENETIIIERFAVLLDHDVDESTDRQVRDAFRVTRQRPQETTESVDYIVQQPGDTNPDVEYVGNVQTIVAAGEGGDDVIHIRSSVGDVNVEVYGASEMQNDLSSQRDRLIYEGTGTAIMFGGGGNDFLKAESGNVSLFGEAGNDELIGGDGINTLEGGIQSDILIGAGQFTVAIGGAGNDTVDGGTAQQAFLFGDNGVPTLTDGDDIIYAADGVTEARSGNGVDEIHGYYGQGPLSVIGGSGVGIDRVYLLASQFDDTINIGPSTSQADVDVTVLPPGENAWLVQLTGVEDITVEGGRGADWTDVANLYGTGVFRVNVNLADDASLETASDITTVHGADDAGPGGATRWDEVTIDTDYVASSSDAFAFFIDPAEPIWKTSARHLIDGVTRVRLADKRLAFNDGDWVISEPSSYTVFVSNQSSSADEIAQDVLNVELHQGAAGLVPDTLAIYGETATVNSIPGPTNVNMGQGIDFLRVNLTEQQETQLTPNGFAIDPGGYFGPLRLDAGLGDGIIQFDAGLHPTDGGAEGEVNLTLENDRLYAEGPGWSFVDDQGFVTEGLGVATHPIEFESTGGRFTRVDLRGSDGRLLVAQDIRRSTIAVRETLSSAFTTVYASNHDVLVSSDATVGQEPVGDLAGIEGSLKVIAENLFSVHEPVDLTISDFAATNGNNDVSVFKVTPQFAGLPLYEQYRDANVVVGFAGPNDEVVIGWEQNVDLGIPPEIRRVTLRGSDQGSVDESITLRGDLDHRVRVESEGGADRVVVMTNRVAEVEVDTGDGTDYVIVGRGGPVNLFNRKPIHVTGDPGSINRLRIVDQAGIAPAAYVLDDDSLATGGTLQTIQDVILYENISRIFLTTTAAGALVGVGDGQQAGRFPPRTRIVMPGTNDTVGAGLQADGSGNEWIVRGHNDALLNRQIRLAGAENLVGGPAGDSFVMRDDGSISGNVWGLEGAPATLDYRRRKTPVQVDLTNFSATDIGGTIAFMDNFVGSMSPLDELTGFSAVDSVWHLTGANEGHILLPQLANLRTDYASFETLVTGSNNDALMFYDESQISGAIQMTPNTAQAFDGADFANVTQDVVAISDQIIEFGTEGTYQPVATIGSLDWMLGSPQDDLLIGGDGPNVLDGREGNDILIGKDGIDWLFGGVGRDILVGGVGADLLGGGAGDDILVGGFTIYDDSPASLFAIRDTWTRKDRTYAQRIALLRVGAAPLVVETTVFTDVEVDQLNGESELDWFWGGLNDQADIDFVNEQFL
ncbi:MAG: calcium-binding protein, partial [Planctomycetota bacterium]